jgi:hypothetical protein
MKGKILEVNAKTGEQTTREIEWPAPVAEPAPTTIDLKDLDKLIKKAKEKGEI